MAALLRRSPLSVRELQGFKTSRARLAQWAAPTADGHLRATRRRIADDQAVLFSEQACRFLEKATL